MRVALVVWTLAFTVLAGSLVTATLLIPSMQTALGSWIIAAAGTAAVVASPIAYFVARATRS
jgi:hypothetical protein